MRAGLNFVIMVFGLQSALEAGIIEKQLSSVDSLGFNQLVINS